MMHRKMGLTGVIAIGMVVAQMLIPVVSYASASVKYVPTAISMRGKNLAHKQHVVAIDPWSGTPTSWISINILQRELKSIGVQTTWNGSTLDVTSVPSGWSEYLISAPAHGISPSGQMQFSIGGEKNEFVRCPKLVVRDPSSGNETTYVPVYYASSFLGNRLWMGAMWKGNTWSLSPQDISGQPSGSKSATKEDFQTLNTVKYTPSEMTKIQGIAHQQGIKVYIPSKMGGSWIATRFEACDCASI